MKKTDVIIIGAGPSGAVAASILQKEGYEVVILEKSIFPRFVIGESLLPRCMEHFEAGGLIPVIEKAGFQKKFGARFVKDGFQSDFNFAAQHSDGWNWTWQVKRADFDQLLIDEVQRRGVEVKFGAEVIDARFDTHQASVKFRHDGVESSMEAKFVIDASGFGRVLPRLLDLDLPSNFPTRMAMFSHISDEILPVGFDTERIDIITHVPGVWAWLIPFSDKTTSIGFVGDPNFFDEFMGTTTEQLASIISTNGYTATRIGTPNFLFEPRIISGYAMGVKQLFGERFVLTGNSAEFLDPIFSSGVTFATESGALAAQLIAKSLRGEQVDWEVDYAQHIKSGVDVFRSYVKGWYEGTLQDVFYSRSKNDEFRRQICSVLAGYVWDRSNPFVRKHSTIIETVANVLRIQQS